MPLNPPPDGAIFDFDGVIIDSLAPVETAINGTLRAHGYPTRSAAELARFIGPPTPTAFVELMGAAEDSATVAAAVATYHEIFARVYLEQTRLVDGMAELLHGLTIPLALATAKERKFVGPLLDRFGLEFAVISAPELAEPKARTVARAQRELGARQPVVIGDRCYDIDAARANGLRVIAVSWGVGEREELREADLIVERPAELAELLA
ncbi:MAG TPA: HAD hydrolase-like protein [Solirubrobacteraceae bacterium]|nr:HAD hydrolase-like protein [Solirubrobacteraceae bacterium]